MAIPVTLERKISFRMLHRKCKTSVFDKKEIDSAKPVSSKLIELDKFIEFFRSAS